MSDKSLDLSKSVYDLCKDNPELKQLLYDLGFTDITKAGMLSTAGRFMTIEKGAAIRKIDLEKIKGTLRDNGYTVD